MKSLSPFRREASTLAEQIRGVYLLGPQKSQIRGGLFYTLAVHKDELLNLQSIYGKAIYIPTPGDSEKCFNDYYFDVRERLKNHQLKQGENATIDTNGELQVGGKIAVMEIQGLIASVIFDKNSNREFYVEESYPLDWMYPYLEPHGLIFKINRQPLTAMPNEVVQQDHILGQNHVAEDW